IKAKLGPGYMVEPAGGQVETMAKMIGSYQVLLNIFGSLALLAALFLISNSIGISVTERQKEIGALRALGGSRSSILKLFLTESFCLGFLGSFIGVWLGRGLAAL